MRYIIRRLPSKGWFTAILYQSVVTFEQAAALALDMARDQQRPYYVIERATGWAITTYKLKRGRSVIVEPPRRNLLDTES